MDRFLSECERWRPIPGFEGIYDASDLGRIRSAPGKTTSNARCDRRVWQTRILKPKHLCTKKRRDERVTLWKDGVPKDYLVARLVAMAWHGVPEDGLTVNHINGNWRDNRPSNLEWVTLRENILHGHASGLYAAVRKQVTLIDESGEAHAFPSMRGADAFLGRGIGYTSNAIRAGFRISSAHGDHYTAEV